MAIFTTCVKKRILAKFSLLGGGRVGEQFQCTFTLNPAFQASAARGTWRYECSGAGGVMVGWTSLSIDGKTVIELCYVRLSGGVDIAFSITESRKKNSK